jgi:hypothetical protein
MLGVLSVFVVIEVGYVSRNIKFHSRSKQMTDDLLNSLLGSGNSGGLEDLLNQGTPEQQQSNPADLLESLLGGGGSADTPDPFSGGDAGNPADLLGALSGGGGNPADLLGALGGGGSSSGGGLLGGLLGSLLGGGGGGTDLSQIPLVGPIVNSLAEKFGIPPAAASALVMGAISLLTKKKSRTQELDISRFGESIAAEKDHVAEIAQAAGLDEEQATAGMQEALQMLMNATE